MGTEKQGWPVSELINNSALTEGMMMTLVPSFLPIYPYGARGTRKEQPGLAANLEKEGAANHPYCSKWEGTTGGSRSFFHCELTRNLDPDSVLFSFIYTCNRLDPDTTGLS